LLGAALCVKRRRGLPVGNQAAERGELAEVIARLEQIEKLSHEGLSVGGR
jgi:hypothetical protein